MRKFKCGQVLRLYSEMTDFWEPVKLAAPGAWRLKNAKVWSGHFRPDMRSPPAKGRIAEMLVTRGSVVAMIWLLLLSSASLAGEVDVGALLKESEEAVEKLDLGLEKAVMLAGLEMAHEKRGDRQQALKLLDRAVQMALKVPLTPNSDWGQYFFPVEAIREQAKLGDVAGAMRNAKAMGQAFERKVPEFGSVAKGQAEAGDVGGAWATCERIDPQWGIWKGMALCDVANALAEAARFDAALQTVEKIEKVPAKDDDTRKSNRACRNYSVFTIACEQAKRGQVKEALQTAERTDGLMRARTLQEIAKIRLERGDQRGAKEAVEMALSIFKRRNNFAQDVSYEMVAAQAEAGDVPGALETTTTFFKGSDKGCALILISIVQAKSGDRNAATRTFKEGLALVKTEKKTLGYLALKLAKAGEFDRALELAALSGNPGNVLREVAVGVAKTGDFGRALTVANSIKNDARNKAEALCEIAAAQAKARQPLARQTFQRAFEAAMADEEEVTALQEIGRSQLQAGYVDAAADTFNEARKRVIVLKLSPSEFQEIAQAQAAGGDPRAALSWARSRSSRPLKARSLVGVLQGLTERPEGVNP
jgi:tetratricopeptide (TPR) repeat protein